MKATEYRGLKSFDIIYRTFNFSGKLYILCSRYTFSWPYIIRYNIVSIVIVLLI